jgi:septum formation protein
LQLYQLEVALRELARGNTYDSAWQKRLFFAFPTPCRSQNSLPVAVPAGFVAIPISQSFRAMFVSYMHTLILASASPRRHELLLAAGLPHIVRVSSIPEVRRPTESPISFVQRIAEEKARAVPREPTDVVLAADTVVCLDDEMFGKPRDDQDAQRMLRSLSGRDHFVYTGVCILQQDRMFTDLAATKVSFALLTEEEIQEYTRSGETRDKAGAYAIQGWASRFVTQIQGCYHNVVGLPVSLVYSHLKSL